MSETDRRGFTLIEVLLSLTILSLAGAVVYGSLSTAVTSWSAGLLDGRRRQVARVALERISQQLKSSVPSAVAGEGKSVAAFDGGDDHLRFVTLLPVSGQPLAQVSYSIEEDDGRSMLVYREYPWPDKKFFEERAEPWVEERLPEIEGMSVVLKAEEENEGLPGAELSGEEEWEPEQGRNPPGEVEITLRIAGAEEEEGQELYRTAVPLLSRPLF